MAKSLADRIRRFVSTRNKSEFQSNLQFHFDLEAAGLKLSDIGTATKLPSGNGYSWQTKAGVLIERWGQLTFDADDEIKA